MKVNPAEMLGPPSLGPSSFSLRKTERKPRKAAPSAPIALSPSKRSGSSSYRASRESTMSSSPLVRRSRAKVCRSLATTSSPRFFRPIPREVSSSVQAPRQTVESDISPPERLKPDSKNLKTSRGFSSKACRFPFLARDSSPLADGDRSGQRSEKHTNGKSNEGELYSPNPTVGGLSIYRCPLPRL